MNTSATLGQTFGRLTIIAEVEPRISRAGKKQRRIVARCQCGNEKQYQLHALKTGNTKSCGCLNREVRAIRRPQPWTVDGDVAYIVLRRRRVLIDAADVPLVNEYRWRMRSDGYVKTGDGVYMHRIILGLKKGDKREGDHSKHVPWDNRRSQLRMANRAQNSWNMRARPSRHKYKGVTISRDRYKAQIRLGDRKHYLGQFDTQAEAARAYDAAAVRHFGEFAHLNFPMEGLAFARQQ